MPTHSPEATLCSRPRRLLLPAPPAPAHEDPGLDPGFAVPDEGPGVPEGCRPGPEALSSPEPSTDHRARGSTTSPLTVATAMAGLRRRTARRAARCADRRAPEAPAVSRPRTAGEADPDSAPEAPGGTKLSVAGRALWRAR